MQTKKGIALVTLVITIIVVVILSSVSIISVSNSLNNAKKASFAEELNQIEDQSLIYYLQNGEEYPAYKDESGEFLTKTPAEIKEILGDKKFNSLKEEMKLNKENGEEDITVETQLAFYVIDLDKLALDKKTRGVKKNGSEEDVYVISAKTNRAYYLKGVKVGGTTYFSLANLMGYTNKVETTETGEVDVTKVGVLTVKRAKKSWTNTMGITLSVEDTTGTISATLKDGETTIASSNFTLKSEYTLNNLSDLTGASFSSSNQTTFNNSKNKKIEFTKGSDTLAVDLSNYDVMAPEVDLSGITKNILENENMITFKVRDTQSGIKVVKYDYLTKYDENGDIQNYYKDTTTLEPSFIKARGKKADISAPDENGYVTVTIKLPYKIEGIQVYIADKAGNYSKDSNGNPITIGAYDFDSDPYIGCDLKSITKSGLTFKAIFNTNDSSKKLTTYKVQVSTNNTTYTGDYSETLSTASVKYSKLINDYKSNMTIEKKAYVKITATIADITYTRIFEFDISDVKDNDNNDSMEDGNMLNFSYLTGKDDDFLGSGVKKKYIKEISFERGTIPENYLLTFDASFGGDDSIIGYVISEESSNYNIVFSSDKTIYANVDSSNLFSYMINLKKISFNNFDTRYVKKMNNMFDQSYMLTSLDLSGFDTSSVIDMSYMFNSCNKLASLDLSNFNTSNVINMSYMFDYCDNLPSLDVSSFNTSNVTNMSYMFGSCASLTSLDVSSFNTSNVTNMHGMFCTCKKLTSLDLSSFNTSNVTNMDSMFGSCTSLTNLDVSSFNTSNVTEMDGMFQSCEVLTSLDLSSFNTSKVTDMRWMFRYCYLLKTIYATNNFNTDNVSSSSSMFTSSTKLVGGNGTKYSISYQDKTYARIDTSSTPGYFTLKTN